MRWSTFTLILFGITMAFTATLLFLESRVQKVEAEFAPADGNFFEPTVSLAALEKTSSVKTILKAKEVLNQRPEFFSASEIWTNSNEYPEWFEGDDDRQKWTVMIGTFSTGGERIAALLWQLKPFEQSIDAIHLNWDREDEIAQANFKDFFSHQYDIKNFTIPVFIFTFEGASINNRWRSLAYSRTELVFSMDDDIFLKPGNIWMSWQWAQKYPHRIVGGGLPMEIVRHSGYDAHFPSNRMDTTMMLNQGFGSFLSKDVLSLYFSLDADITTAREHVKEQRNCEDILINYIILYFAERDSRWQESWGTNIYVFPKNTHLYKRWKPTLKKSYEQQDSGLSSQGDHAGTRHRCVKLFENLWNHPEFPITNDTISFSPECPRRWDPPRGISTCEKMGKQATKDIIGNSFDEFCSWFKKPSPCKTLNGTSHEG